MNDNNGQAVVDVIAHSIEGNTSRRVYGDPVTLGDVTIIPAAKVIGRGGGGSGTSPEHQQGQGGGLMQSARPVGALVVRGSDVSWRPALDKTRIIIGGQVVAVVALLVLRSIAKRRRKRHR